MSKKVRSDSARFTARARVPAKAQAAPRAKPAATAAQRYWSEAVASPKDLFELVSENPLGLRLHGDITKKIPVVPREDAKLLYVDAHVLDELGLRLGRHGRLSADEERALCAAFAVRPAGEGETPTHSVAATRYHDLSHGKTFGAVRGDGRAGILGRPIAVEGGHDARGGGGRDLLNLRVKGVPTGLKPAGTPKGDGHGTGLLSETNALCDSVMGSYLSRNGVDVNRAVAVAGTDQSYDYYFVLGGVRKDFSSRVGFQLLAGSFDRLAHLNFYDAKPERLRELIDDVGLQVSAQLGRKRPLGHAALYAWLVAQRSRQLADMYWARTVHGSTTYDNVGLRETIDVATAATVDRAHPTYRPVTHISRGFGKEAEEVLRNMVAGELTGFFEKTGTPREREELAAMDPGRLAYGTWVERMAANALEHLGFDDDLVRTMLKHHRAEVYAFFDAVHEIGEEQQAGAAYGMGPKKDPVEDPARYDIFAALGTLAAIAGSGAPEGKKLKQLSGALAPLAPDASRDGAAAKRLLEAAAPLMKLALAGADGAAREERLALIADQARRINEPVTEFTYGAIRGWTAGALERVHEGKLSVTRLRAEIDALVRRNVRRGPESAAAVAMDVRHGRRPVDETGRLELARVEENGVCIQELSDGARDLVRFSIATDPLSLGDAGRYRLRYTVDGERWREAAPTRVEDGEAIFEVPLAQAPKELAAAFFDAQDPAKRWDQDGLCFGRGHAPVLASSMVDAELAAFAERNGMRRAGTPEARRKAVAGNAPVEIGQRRIDWKELAAGPEAASIAHRFASGLAQEGAPYGELYRLANGAVATGFQTGGRDGSAVVANSEDGQAYVVPAAIYDAYEPFCLELGLPRGDATRGAGGALTQQFERGTVAFTPRGGATITRADG